MSQPPYPSPDGPAPSQPAGAGPLVLDLVAAGAGLLGALGGGLVATALFAGNAGAFGRVVGEAMAPSLEESLTGSAERSMDDLAEVLESIQAQQYAAAGPGGTVPRSPSRATWLGRGAGPLRPELLRGRPAGVRRAVLPLAARVGYETYAASCGGRVKPFVVPMCTDLE